MAGKRQHYVPRFLQRGFLHDPQEKAERTWLHRRGTKPVLVGISDVGVSEYFYSKLRTDGVATLDDIITAVEGGLDSELSAIRATPVGGVIDSLAAARLTTHLMLRTAHVRSVFAQGAAQILDGAASLFADTAAVREHFGVDSLAGPTSLHTALDEIMQKLPLEALSIPRPLARRIASFMAREKFDALYEEHGPMIVRVIARMAKEIPATIRDAHNRALETTKGERWEKDLAAFSWRIHAIIGAVLPDCVVLAHEAGDDFTPFLLSEREKVDLVILAFAHDRLLVGSRSLNIPIAVEVLNAASAACSENFFISRCAADGTGLSPLIGQRSAKVIEASVGGALSPFQLTRGDEAHRNQVEERVTEIETVSSFSFSLTCVGFADADLAAKLGEIVNVIVQEMNRSMPLSTLDGMTFAVDYPAAVEGVDRGDQALSAAQSLPREYGRAVAKEIQVVRNGVSKSHIVLDSSIAGGLLSDDERDRACAVHAIVTMLAGVAHTALYEIRLKHATAVPPDEVVRFLHQSASGAPGRYFAARESAFADPNAGERYATLVRDSLVSAREAIKKARLAYRINSNLDALLGAALPQISFILTHAAEWLGHRDGLPDQDEFPGASLLADLQTDELHHWLELFGRDLRNLYDAAGQFTTAHIFALGRHVERLLWTVQICPWPKEDGSLYITVPPGNDAALLEAVRSSPSVD